MSFEEAVHIKVCVQQSGLPSSTCVVIRTVCVVRYLAYHFTGENMQNTLLTISAPIVCWYGYIVIHTSRGGFLYL